jgi:arabinofuranosyltransferase
MLIFDRCQIEFWSHESGFVMELLTGRKAFLVVAMLATAVMLLGTAWICDDAFITLRVIDNFVDGFGLRYNVIERVQVFTHPLWFWFLTPFYALTREAMVTTMLVSVVVSLGAMWLIATRIAKNIEYGCLIVLVALASRSISYFSTSGLETPLTFFLLALLVWQLYRSDEAGQPGKAWVAAGIAGLLLLNRLDLAVLLGPVLAYLLFRTRGGDRVKVAVAAVFPALAWMVFSIIYYGALFPNTAYAKLGTGFNTVTLILRWLVYAKDFVLTDPLLALIIVKVVFDTLRSRDWLTRLLGVGIVLYVAYTIVIGGDFMSGRFFTPPGFLAVCLLARAPVPQWLTDRAKLFALIVCAGVLAALLAMRVTEKPYPSFPANGITDERRYYYLNNGLLPVLKIWLATGTEPVHPWGQRGLEFKYEAQRIGRPIVLVLGNSNAGMAGYYAGPEVHNVDKYALTDAFLARLPAVPNSRIGHYERILPPGYAETALNAAPTTEVAALRPLLDDVTLVTRAPLFEDGRWGAIWRLLSGHYSWVYEADIYGARK